MCPKGDDPFTTFTDYYTITITTTAASGTLAGQFQFIFEGEYFYFNAAASSFDDTDCKDSFEGLANIETVSCTRGTIDARAGAQYVIQIQEFPTYPYQNNIYSHNGNPSLSSFQCKTDRVTGGTTPTCTVGIVATASTPGKYPFILSFVHYFI